MINFKINRFDNCLLLITLVFSPNLLSIMITKKSLYSKCSVLVTDYYYFKKYKINNRFENM